MKNEISSRRSFVKSVGTVAASTILLPSLVACKNENESDVSEAPKAASKRIADQNQIVGHGDFTYKVNKEWGVQNIKKYPVMDCHEMVQDKQGRLLLYTNHIKNNMIIYDRSGKVLNTWTLGLEGAHGLTLSDEGGEEFLYLSNTTDHTVVKTDLKGNKLLELKYPKETGKYESEDKYLPTEIAIGPNGDIYVADGYGQNFIMQYSQKGELIRYWGGNGDGDEEFDCCHGVTLDNRDKTNPTLLITSRSKQEFKRFSLDGKHLETIKLPGCWICRPVIKSDYLYFAVIVTKSWGTYDGCVAVLDKNNRVVSLPGASTPIYNDGVLEEPMYDDFSFLNPHDVCIDNDENIIVPQWSSGRTYPVMLERV